MPDDYKGIGGNYESNNKPVKKLKADKRKCSNCGCIAYRMQCPKCGHGMWKYDQSFDNIK